MPERKSTALCEGCHDNFYNGNNKLGVKECWSLKSAKVVRRWRQGWWTDGDVPGAFVEVETYNCHNEPGQFVFLDKLPKFAVDPVKLVKT
jgi:hypothetical protein